MKYVLKISSDNAAELSKVLIALRNVEFFESENEGYVPSIKVPEHFDIGFSLEKEPVTQVGMEPADVTLPVEQVISAKEQLVDTEEQLIGIETQLVDTKEHFVDIKVKLKNCVECGQNFEPKKKDDELCSKKCYHRKYDRERDKKKVKLKDPKPEIKTEIKTESDGRICIVCKKGFAPSSETSRTCSKTCYMKNYFHPERYQKIENPTHTDRPKRSLEEKLEEISKTYPKPTARPEASRDFS